MYEFTVDETDPEATARIGAFLDDYKALCRRHGCLVVADGSEVEVSPLRELAEESDPWGVEEETRDRGWNLPSPAPGKHDKTVRDQLKGK